jgi:DNA polymerase-3 subunit gamma/tau
MEKFIVSARKYRPQIFNTVVGQSHITTTLKNAILNNQLAHAFLFCGPRGVGKTTCARILAKTINCTKRTADGEACDKCNSCTSFNDGTSMNIHELDAASNNSVDDIRSLVEQVRFAPQAGDYKVYIIDEVHMLTQQAFNAFLKTLEEPPSYAKFILATTEKHKILPTILSRCQIFDFKRITTNDTVQHLEEICVKENITAEKAALQVIAQKSEGCMRDALSIMDKIASFTNGALQYKNTLEHLNILDEEYFFQFVDFFIAENLPATLLLFDEINKKGFEGDTLLLGMAEFIRNLLVSKDEKAAILLEAIESFRKKYISTAKELDANWLISALNILNDAEINYKQARNKKLHVELCLIKLCYLQQALEASIQNNGVSFKKKVAKGPIAFKTNKVQSLTSYVKISKTTNESSVFIETPKNIVTSIIPTPKIKSEVINEIPKPKLSLTALNEIRKKAKETKEGKQDLEQKKLTLEEIKKVWREVSEKINVGGNLQSVQSTFDLAVLEMISETSFTITLGSNVQQKVVEEYKKTVMQEMVAYFNNKQISFELFVNEQHNQLPEVEIKVSAKDQYFKIIEEYPLVKELKDRLGLELDY